MASATLQGLMRRLDYLHGLGVTAIWLMPFQTSPCRDDGYDISDYYSVDPRYGTLGDFVEFTHGAQAARHPRDHRPRRQPHLRPASMVPGGAPRSRTRDIATGTCGRRRSRANAHKGMVFPGVQKTTWSYDSVARRLVLPPLLRFPARPQHLEPARAGRDPEDHGLLDSARRLGLPHGCRAVRHLDQGAERRASPSSSTTCCARCASSCNGGRATRSSSPKRTCCRRRTWTISATTAIACT